MARALIIVDVQNDFCEGGSLAVAGGGEVAAQVSALVGAGGYDVVAATADHHVDPGDHFAVEPDFVDTWPEHCVAGTSGAQFHPALDTSGVDAVFRKGHHAAAYSGFQGVTAGAVGDEGLAAWLWARDVTQVDVVGLATDHCVRATALDAARLGFDTTVLLDLTAGVTEATTRTALAELAQAGVRLEGAARVGPVQVAPAR